MPIFSILFLIFPYLQFYTIEFTIKSLSTPSQKFCTSLLDFPSVHLHLYRAIACGVSVKDSSYEILKTVSLWHLIIVSAGHFQVILWILNKVKFQLKVIPHFVLLLFCLATGAQPPVVRAFVDFELRNNSKKFKLLIPYEYCILYSSCIVLLCFPSWTHSWSFLLSWLCGILVLLLQKQSLLIQALGISIGVFPIAAIFSNPHPLGFLFNIIFAPPLSVVLFPLSLIMILFPFLHRIVDPLVDFLLFILNALVSSTNDLKITHYEFNQKNFIIAWIYVLLLQLFVIFKKKQEHNFEN